MASAPSIHNRPDATPIAPWWHTAVFLVLIGTFSVLGAYEGTGHAAVLSRTHLSGAGVRIARYLGSVAFEWLLVLFVWLGIRARGVTLRALIGGRWPTWRAALRDLGIGVVFLIVSYTIIGILLSLLHVQPGLDKNPLLPLLPHGWGELAVFCLVALSAGFCEEVLFRGYLMRQLSAVTRSTAGGLLLQGVAFGLGHGYQGLARMAVITVEGCLLGLLARWRQSLRPGMMAHALQDVVAGVAMFAVTR